MSVRPPLLDEVARRGHAVFERGLYNLNIIGIRSPDRTSNEFNDRICVVYRDGNGWVTRTFAATTDPGVYWREHPMNVRGTAILCPGQYRGSHVLGHHRGRYRALVQARPVKYWRDSNRDEVLDMEPGTDESGVVGLNIHRASASRRSTEIGKFSAGCQVFADPDEFDLFVGLCEKAAELYGPRFSYTLIEMG